MVLVYVPAAWFTAGVTWPPTHTNSRPEPLSEGFAPVATVKLDPPAALVVLY